MLMPHVQCGLDLGSREQVIARLGSKQVFAQAPATDQRPSPTPFPDPWAPFAGVASQAAGGSIPVPPPHSRRGHKSLLMWNHQPVWRESTRGMICLRWCDFPYSHQLVSIELIELDFPSKHGCGMPTFKKVVLNAKVIF